MGHYPQVITVTSGKGGVGKTNIAVNLACRLGEKARVILLDADLGLANVDVLLGVTPPHELSQLFSDGVRLEDILFPTPYGFSILPTASGLENIVELSTGQKLELLNAMDSIADSTDYLIVDTGAGINTNVLYFCMAARQRLLVVTPEPTSLTDAYALIKVLHIKHGIDTFRVCINMAPDVKTAKQIFGRLCDACDQFLTGVSLDLSGIIPFDAEVRRAMEGLALRVAKEKASPDEAFTDNVIMYEVLSELKAQGRNLNQLTTLANMGRITAVNVQEACSLYADIQRSLKTLLERTV